MSKILILGSTGLLGQSLMKEIKSRGIEVTGVARSNADVCFDITDDNTLISFIKKNRFSIIINTCAIVNHKLCEQNNALAYQVNSRPSAILANLAKENNAYYVYISTDGYYSGDRDYKHTEEHDIKLFNEYARTKYCGEVFTLTNPDSLVIRTNIVGFRGKADQPTFVEWVINSLTNNVEMTLFNDYYTSSISVTQFAKALCDLLPKKISGILNLACSQVSTKLQFINKLAKEFNLNLNNAKEGTVNSLAGSFRPDSLGLDTSKAEKLLGYALPNLDEVIIQLKKDYYEVG